MKTGNILDWGFAVALIALFCYFVFGYNSKPKPKEMTPLDLSVILTDKVNKQNAQIRQLKTELDQVKRQLAGELPQIHGGVSYDTRRTSK